MSDQIRAWSIWRSIGYALLVGIVAGLVTAGLFSNQLVGTLEIKTALWVGLGVGIVLTALLVVLFDRLSRLMGQVNRAAKQGSKDPGATGRQIGKQMGSLFRKRR